MYNNGMSDEIASNIFKMHTFLNYVFVRKDTTGCGMLSLLHFDTNQQNMMTDCVFNPHGAGHNLIDTPTNVLFLTITDALLHAK